VVDISELPESDQQRVNQATEQASEEDLAGLRASIDANAQASAALQSEGMTSERVIAALMTNDGKLLLVTRAG
jgi:hypothetical protein